MRVLRSDMSSWKRGKRASHSFWKQSIEALVVFSLCVKISGCSDVDELMSTYPLIDG